MQEKRKFAKHCLVLRTIFIANVLLFNKTTTDGQNKGIYLHYLCRLFSHVSETLYKILLIENREFN